MVKHLWSIVCREAIVNQENSALSLMNIFEGFDVEVKKDSPQGTEIVLPVEYEIVTMLRKDSRSKEEKIELRAKLFDPNDQQVIDPIIVPITMPKNKFNFRQKIKNFGFKITVQGEYRFIVEIKQEGKKDFCQVAEVPININIKKK